MPEKEIIQRIVEGSIPGFWGAIGAGCNFMYRVSQGMPFKTSMFILNLALGFLMCLILGQFLAQGIPYRDGIVGVCGISTLHILGFLEHGGWQVVVNAFLRAFKLQEIDFSKNAGLDTEKNAGTR